MLLHIVEEGWEEPVIEERCDPERTTLEKFIDLRLDNRFEMARRNFVAELNRILDYFVCNSCSRCTFFWDVGNLGISLDTFMQHGYAAKEYMERIEGKRQARKYLARIKQLRPERLFWYIDNCQNILFVIHLISYIRI